MKQLTTGIQVKSISFGATPFRKLQALEITFAPRLTLIAGHNGIGKSTILGLVANTFGDTSDSGPRSYFGEPYYANIERIVYLGLEEVDRNQADSASSPTITASVHGVEVVKRCAMTRRSAHRRARVVPRTVNRSEDDPVGPDAKIPLPAIYLGIKRLTSIGEADEKEVESTALQMHEDDSTLMVDFVRSVILSSTPNANITRQSIKGSKKRSAQPGYEDHDAQAISVGQDSLGSIATALASFNRLKREAGTAYAGGLLIIDELDAGFHPHAIAALATALKRYAGRLQLQIIATTHSPRLIEAIHPDGGGNVNAPDTVVYLVDTRKPRLAEDQRLAAIRSDMELSADITPTSKRRKPTLFIYFEDREGAQFFSELVPTAARNRLGRRHGVTIKCVPLFAGGTNMIKFPSVDPMFRTRVLAVDGDTPVPAKMMAYGNILKLPCVHGASGTNRSPENTIKGFLRAVARATDGQLYEAMRNIGPANASGDRIQAKFFPEDSGSSNGRVSSKSWWETHWTALKSWNVVREWAACHTDEIDAFNSALDQTIQAAVKRLTA
ncbi:AAA family ATPase [Hydrogenophaga sp. BPS33]|uniref:AAA family ATPase n=1 Tax=Hydrogenophaga sp. BPS33 TaxID=2651974 RepID=UPI00131F50F2|nr:AAA family ATPase [Hydrogenophaga sp. BPS33]QHE84514.1 AAA family ATPase [Hydrogenophaga sp. BPS33]